MKFALLLVLCLPLACGATTCREALRAAEAVNVEAAALAIADMAAGPGSFDAARHCAALAAFTVRRAALVAALAKNDASVVDEAERLAAGVRAALLANPLLDFDRLLVVRRDPKHLGLPANWEGNSSLPPRGYTNALAVLSAIHSNAEVRTLYHVSRSGITRDLEEMRAKGIRGALVFDAGGERTLAGVGNTDGWSRPPATAADPGCRRGQLRRLLPAGRQCDLLLDRKP